MLKNIMKILMRKDLPKPLGRWNIDYCNKKINNKIDLSNEDHCGPCGQYAITKIDENIKNKIQCYNSPPNKLPNKTP
jgi:hypothetical protein